MDSLEPSFRGMSEPFEQGYAGTEEHLVKPEVPACDGLKRSVDTKFICHKPVMPSFHGFLAGPIFRVSIVRLNDLIQDAGDHLSGILLEYDHQVRKHAVKLSASRIITPASGDPEPFRNAPLMSKDSFAVITITQMTFFTGRAKIISALN